MAKFSKEDIYELAELSSLKLNDKEVVWLQEQLIKTLEYTEELEQFEGHEEHEAVKTINVFREDRAKLKDSSDLLKQAPQTEETYFVVPKILD